MIIVPKEELKKAVPYIIGYWHKQTDELDKKTKFIYKETSFEGCLKKGRDVGELVYALHRWYNFHTSKRCENILISCGAECVEDEFDHDKDIFINKIPYDVKLTVFPNKLSREKADYDLRKREEKNKLIKWFYQNQSQQGRKHLKNRLFIVCCGETDREKLELKSEFEKIEEVCRKYMKHLEDNSQNKLEIEDNNGEKHFVYSEILCIK